MSEQLVLEDQLGSDGIYRLHVMSADAVEWEIPIHATVQKGTDAGMHSLKAQWLWRDAVILDVPQFEWQRRVILYGLQPDERISTGAVTAATLHLHRFGEAPEYAWLKQLPQGVALGTPIPFVGGELSLMEMLFLPSGFVAVGK